MKKFLTDPDNVEINVDEERSRIEKTLLLIELIDLFENKTFLIIENSKATTIMKLSNYIVGLDKSFIFYLVIFKSSLFLYVSEIDSNYCLANYSASPMTTSPAALTFDFFTVVLCFGTLTFSGLVAALRKDSGALMISIFFSNSKQKKKKKRKKQKQKIIKRKKAKTKSNKNNKNEQQKENEYIKIIIKINSNNNTNENEYQ
jgi:hypothetical protein